MYTNIALLTVTIANNDGMKFSTGIHPPFDVFKPNTANPLTYYCHISLLLIHDPTLSSKILNNDSLCLHYFFAFLFSPRCCPSFNHVFPLI